jgi:hypothetical protein
MNKEIIWNLVNAGLAGGLVFLGACSTGHMDKDTFIIAAIVGITAAVIQFKDYWAKEEEEYKYKKLFQFL